MAEFRLLKKYRAIRLRYDAFTWAATAYERILIPDNITTGATEDCAYLSEGVDGNDPADLEGTFILPVSMDDAIIDGDVFVNVKIYLDDPSDGFSCCNAVYATIKKIDSAGSATSLSADNVQIFNDTIMWGASETGQNYYQIFGWVPVYDKQINSDERLALYLKAHFYDTLGDVEGGWYFTPDSDETYIIVPFV